MKKMEPCLPCTQMCSLYVNREYKTSQRFFTWESYVRLSCFRSLSKRIGFFSKQVRLRLHHCANVEWNNEHGSFQSENDIDRCMLGKEIFLFSWVAKNDGAFYHYYLGLVKSVSWMSADLENISRITLWFISANPPGQWHRVQQSLTVGPWPRPKSFDFINWALCHSITSVATGLGKSVHG